MLNQSYKVGDKYQIEGEKFLGTIIYVLPSIIFYVNEFRLIRLNGSVEYHSLMGVAPLEFPHRDSIYGDFEVKSPDEPPPDWWTGKYELDEPRKAVW